MTGGTVAGEKFFACFFGWSCEQGEGSGKYERENPTNAFQQHISGIN
jgi:hypothetical protein